MNLNQSEKLFNWIILSIVLAALAVWIAGCSTPPVKSAEPIRVSAAERTE